MDKSEKMEKTCCFTGHRNIPYAIKPLIYEKLKTEILKLIDEGVIYFGAGGAIGFDTLAANAVLELKAFNPKIKLILVLPCKEQTSLWNYKDINVYNNIIRRADKVVYLSEKYTAGCMHKRNRHLVDNSKYCIAYLNKVGGGTAYTVNYAKKCGKTVINIGELND